MEKYIIARSSDRYIDMVIRVKNYDNGFYAAARSAADEWNDNDTTDFAPFVSEKLKEAGYEVELLDYEIINED